MFSKVLLPVDLNHIEAASSAINAAQKIVETSGGDLHIISVTPDFGMAMVGEYFPEGFEKKMLEKASSDLKAFAEAKISKNVKTHLHIAHGHVPEEILDAAAKLDADVIVMASHNPDRVRDFLVGSNAERVVRHSQVSVLITRGD